MMIKCNNKLLNKTFLIIKLIAIYKLKILLRVNKKKKYWEVA